MQWFTCALSRLDLDSVQKSEKERGPEISVESTHKGVNQRSKDVTQTQQQRPESPTVTLTWHASKYKVHKLYWRYRLQSDGGSWQLYCFSFRSMVFRIRSAIEQITKLELLRSVLLYIYI